MVRVICLVMLAELRGKKPLEDDSVTILRGCLSTMLWLKREIVATLLGAPTLGCSGHQSSIISGYPDCSRIHPFHLSWSSTELRKEISGTILLLRLPTLTASLRGRQRQPIRVDQDSTWTHDIHFVSLGTCHENIRAIDTAQEPSFLHIVHR